MAETGNDIPTAVTASIHFLTKDASFREIKPYAFRFELEDDNIPQTNMRMRESTGINIQNIRGNEAAFSLDRQGFEVMTLESSLTYADFADPEKLPIYFEELESLLAKRLGATEVKVFRHGIRKRHAQFPISTGRRYEHDQPTSVAHVDTTPDEMMEEVQRQFSTIGGLGVTEKVQWINVWKPLRGPLNDWPLTICDGTTIAPEMDFESADILYPDLATENFQIYPSDRQRWYYLSDHQPDELMVFNQASTLTNGPPGKSSFCSAQSHPL